MSRVLRYLQIPDDDDGDRLGLGWSPSGDAVERRDGSTFAFAPEIALFLEGYASAGPLIHFGYALHLIHHLSRRAYTSEERSPAPDWPTPATAPASYALTDAFRKAKRPYRNAGVFCARLCREIPPATDPPDAVDLCRRLADGSLMSELAVQRAATSPLASEGEAPPIPALEFNVRFLEALRKVDPEEVDCWLRHGRGPVPHPGDRVAEEVLALRPRTLDGALEALSARERLAGALPMVAQLVGALTLPPRRLAHRALPTGGYADVATRGRPEQILPSQFAVDDVEFLRRFAENELLYFHREEPHAPVAEELVVLLDQGVRTWGRVRHALAASALAFGKLAARRKLRLLLATTGTEGRPVDPLAVSDDELGGLWEASDLSPGPAMALSNLLDDRGAARRDVVVLSHPRSVADPEFAPATRRAGEGSRVFSVAVDEPGLVQFREWRRGGAVKVGDFRVDFSPPRPTSTGDAPSASAVDPRGWRGDVEVVPYPFRFGVVHRIDRPLFDFDHAGRWLLVSTHRGMLHAWKLDGTRAEVLPRAMVDGEVMEQVDAVLGVADGFVVGGRLGRSLVAMHYDFGSRTARAHVLGPTLDGEWLWFYSREAHTVVARGRDYSRSLDLSTREVHRSRGDRTRPPVRSIRAFEMAANHFLPPPRLPIVEGGSPVPLKGPYVRLDRDSGEIRVERAFPEWEPFTPLTDGVPTLRQGWVDHAQLRGNVLALLASKPGRKPLLHLFRGPSGWEGRVFHPATADPSGFALSRNGRLIATRLNERQLEVREVAGPDRPVFTTTKGRTHPNARVVLGRYGMVIHVGNHVSLIRWDLDRLTISTVPEGSTRSEQDVITWPIDRPAQRSSPLPAPLAHDPHRFVATARSGLSAVVDIFGQVAVFDAEDRLVAMFLAFRSQVAAWTPDGTRLGPSQGPYPLIDGPATKNAAEIIGRALKAASDARPDSARTAKPDRP